MHFTLRKSIKIVQIGKWFDKRHLDIFYDRKTRSKLASLVLSYFQTLQNNFQGKNAIKNLAKNFLKFHLVSHYALYHYSWCKAMSAAAARRGIVCRIFEDIKRYLLRWCHMLEGCFAIWAANLLWLIKVSTNVQTNLCLPRVTCYNSFFFHDFNDTCRHKN